MSITHEQRNLIFREIDETRLPKKATNILHKCDRLIAHYNAVGSPVSEVALFPDDYRELFNALHEDEQVLSECVYKGYRLVRCG